MILSDVTTDFTSQFSFSFSPTGSVDHVTFFVYFWKICNYQSYPYLMWKSSNVVRITLVQNIFSAVLVLILFLISSKHFRIVIKILITKPESELLIVSHLSESSDIPAGCVVLVGGDRCQPASCPCEPL